MSDHTTKRPDPVARTFPRVGLAVVLVGVLILSVTSVAVTDRAPGPVPYGWVPALILLAVSALVCAVPPLLGRFPQLRSPLTYGTAAQLRRFLDWFLGGMAVCALAGYLGTTGLAESWGVSFTGAAFAGVGALLISMGIGYPRGGPDYDGPILFVAVATREFARFAPLQRYGTSLLGVALVVTGNWLPAPALLVPTLAAAALWVAPWIVALARATRAEGERQP